MILLHNFIKDNFGSRPVLKRNSDSSEQMSLQEHLCYFNTFYRISGFSPLYKTKQRLQTNQFIVDFNFNFIPLN